MKKTKYKNFIVPLAVYPFDVMFSVGQTDDELKQSLQENMLDEHVNIFLEDDCLFNMPITCKARTVHNLIGGQTVLRLRGVPGTGEERGHLAHEIFHATDFILRRIGLKLTEDSDEAYAYVIQYLTEQFYYNI